MADQDGQATEVARHRRLAEEHDEIAEHWATRGHLGYAADHRDAAIDERKVAESAGSSPLPELSKKIEELRQRG
jgi:hypothetical protein